ncbi:MAG: hypothetical protein CMM47_07180 [Rhodospirillaceae bacterium]|mgnify:CR=1 FL=1|nr:hypothetical protein [Rhodospirillaceae bacterium]
MDPSLGRKQEGDHQEPFRRRINDLFFELWAFGSNALVSWCATRHGIDILTVPKVRLFNLKETHPRVFKGRRRLDPESFQRIARSLETQPVEIRLDFTIGDEESGLGHDDVEKLITNYTTLLTDYRAVVLLDIVGFSKHTPEAQASQLATLEFALNIAEETCIQKKLPVEMKRSTTGDGFYLWNSKTGPKADIALFVLMSLFLTYYGALKRSITEKNATPEIRTAASVGSHYTFYNPRKNIVGKSEEYIVGDVTISVARLVGKTKTNQIVIGAFKRPTADGVAEIRAEQMIAMAHEELTKFEGIMLFGNPVDRFAFYLTGPKRQDGSYVNQKMRIVDKHGFEHFCFNGKVNVFVEGDDPYFAGLQHLDLIGHRRPQAAR